MSTLSDGLASLADDLTAQAGELVTYTRTGNGIQVLVTACRGRNTPQRQALADGRVDLTQEPQDWLVKPAALDYGAGPFLPARGDRIQDAKGRVYELLPRDGENEWRPSDAFAAMLRLRTIRVGGPQ